MNPRRESFSASTRAVYWIFMCSTFTSTPFARAEARTKIVRNKTCAAFRCFPRDTFPTHSRLRCHDKSEKWNFFMIMISRDNELTVFGLHCALREGRKNFHAHFSTLKSSAKSWKWLARRFQWWLNLALRWLSRGLTGFAWEWVHVGLGNPR